MTNIEGTKQAELTWLLGELLVRFYEEYPAEPGPTFIPGRFPYTYAADCLRRFPNLVPEDVRVDAVIHGYEHGLWPPSSRAAAAHHETVWARERGLHRALLSVALAMVFCRHEGVKVDPARYVEVMAEIESGKHDGDN